MTKHPIHFDHTKGFSYGTTPTDLFSTKRIDLYKATEKLLPAFVKFGKEWHTDNLYTIWQQLMYLGYGHNDFFRIDYSADVRPSNWNGKPFILVEKNVGFMTEYSKSLECFVNVQVHAYLVAQSYVTQPLAELAEKLLYVHFNDLLCAENDRNPLASELRKAVLQNPTMTLRGLIDYLKNDLGNVLSDTSKNIRKGDQAKYWLGMKLTDLADIIKGNDRGLSFPLSERITIYFDEEQGTIIYYNIKNNPNDNNFVGFVQIPIEALWEANWEMIENAFCQSGPCKTYKTGTIKSLDLLDKAPVVLLRSRFTKE